MIGLQPADSHFWLCRPDELHLSPDYLELLTSILSDEELARMQRFKFAEHRTLFCISHAFTRYVLSLYAPIEPPDWVFTKGEHGKPYIGNNGYKDLFFSLSHTKGLVALYIAKGHEVGCDVEGHKASVRGRDIAKRFFSSDEVDEYMAFEESLRYSYFFDYWSLKESYIKAKGKGLAIPLGKFSFRLRDRPITFHADDELEEQGIDWTFQLLDVDPRYSAAIATRQTRPSVRHWRGRPLLDHQEIALKVR